MLYRGYHVVANTWWSRPNHSQAHIEKLPWGRTFIVGNVVTDTIFWHRVKSWENKSKLLFDFQMVLFDRFLYFYRYLVI